MQFSLFHLRVLTLEILYRERLPTNDVIFQGRLLTVLCGSCIARSRLNLRKSSPFLLPPPRRSQKLSCVRKCCKTHNKNAHVPLLYNTHMFSMFFIDSSSTNYYYLGSLDQAPLPCKQMTAFLTIHDSNDSHDRQLNTRLTEIFSINSCNKRFPLPEVGLETRTYGL